MVVLTTSKFEKVIIHPTVLLGIVDHMNRVLKETDDTRVIGALLGTTRKGVVDVKNCFGVPFKEKPDEGIWVLDVDFVEEMVAMHRKCNAHEYVVGWYQTGPKLQLIDIEINERFRTINPDVIAVLVDPKPKDFGIPTKAFVAVDETHEDGRPTTKTFQHIKIEVGADEAEEVGVEHLLRDIGSVDVHSLSQGALNHLMSLRGLETYLNDISNYLKDVGEKKLPINLEILERIQSILYELPLITNPDVKKALTLHGNGDAAVVFVALLTRTVLALNDLINNKITTKTAEEKTESAKDKRPKSPPPVSDTI